LKLDRSIRTWRPVPFSGAGLLLFLLTGGATLGCDGPAELPADPEVERARILGLPDGARSYRILLGGRGAEEHLLPPRIRAVPGDAVEFTTVDHRVHWVTFPPDSLSAPLAAFLAVTQQGESPPLHSRGSRFIILLEDAPPGRYPFVSHGHGGVAHGVIEVAALVDSLASTGS
jgi:plastocyanin